MDTLAFLRAVWPAQGHYCLLINTDRGKRQFFYDTIEDAADKAAIFNGRGDTVYHACASFKTAENRKSENAAYAKALWLDLDVGADDPTKFPSIDVAARELKAFVEKVHLPKPWVIHSGGGLHVYWVFHEQCEIAIVRNVAKTLKKLAAFHQFKIDQTRTGDMSSVLRPVGTLNRKYKPARDVVALNPLYPHAFGELAKLIADAAKVLPASARERKKGVNSDIMAPISYPPADADQVADRCQQVALMRDWRTTHAPVPEPVWYSILEVVHFCKDGDDAIHRWSEGHNAYVKEETDAKIAQIRRLGPTTCDTFLSRNPAGCTGCPFQGKITSPIQLGVKFTELPPPTQSANAGRVAGSERAGIRADADGGTVQQPGSEAAPAQSGPSSDDGMGEEESERQGLARPDEFIPPPRGFTRTTEGIVFTSDDGLITIAYQYDMFVVEMGFDDAAGHEVTVVRHHLPQEGWRDFAFRSAAVASDKDFEQAMRDNHVKPVHTRALRAYVAAYMLEVQKVKAMRRLYSSMGWKDDLDYFVLGTEAFYPTGHIEQVGISPSVKAVAEGIKTRGSLETWATQTTLFNDPGMAAHALLFAAGAGAPLMRFTGFEGALFNAVGRSNAGKTSMARFFLSMYGDFSALKLKQRDTDNAKIGRIGALSSLPAYVDEITNEDPQAVSDFIYEITQGRSKLRLRQDGSERDTHAWHTIVVSSSNTPLSGKLGVAKSNPEAERLRLFEFRVERQLAFDDDVATRLYRVCSENYGHAGRAYIQYLVTHRERVRAGLEDFTKRFRGATKARGEERMWMASLSCALYGLMIMKGLGLIRFDVKHVVQWTIKQVLASRQEMENERFDPIDALADYLNMHANTRLTVRQNGTKVSGMDDFIVERYPTQELHMRYDLTIQKIWIDRRHFKNWLVECYQDYDDVLAFLRKEFVFLRFCRKTLGSGTAVGSSSTDCLELDMAAPILGNVTAAVVKLEGDAEGLRLAKFDAAKHRKGRPPGGVRFDMARGEWVTERKV